MWDGITEQTDGQDWVINQSSFNERVMAFVAIPTVDELRTYLKYYMIKVDRVLEISSYHYQLTGSPYSELSEAQCKQLIELLQELCLEFGPWQFNIMIQSDYSFTLNWIESDSGLGKYINLKVE